MEWLLIVIGWITCIILVFSLVELLVGYSKIKNLTKQCILPDVKLPSVSIILSALNEEKDIEKALTTLINLDYPSLEIIAINDRSTDQTPVILERLQKKYSRLQVHHIEQLPDGWFGKNHALHYASSLATGDWLLFTDADVCMKKETLLRAMSYVIDHKLDHLTLFEHHLRREFWLKLLLLAHYIAYSMVMKPWRIRYAWSKKSLGHGAFNLVNKKAYQTCGGHAPIALECIDDLKLGEMLKKKGYQQDTVDGRDFVEREWYSSARHMIEGCKKNGFAYFDYRPIGLFFVLVAAFLFYVWPWFGIFFADPIRYVNLINILLTLVITFFTAKAFRLETRYILFYPIGCCMLFYSLYTSARFFYQNKGVVWRGTFYSLNNFRSTR